MILGIRTRIIYDFLVIIQGSYMISLVSYKDRTKKSSMDSMKSYMILYEIKETSTRVYHTLTV